MNKVVRAESAEGGLEVRNLGTRAGIIFKFKSSNSIQRNEVLHEKSKCVKFLRCKYCFLTYNKTNFYTVNHLSSFTRQ